MLENNKEYILKIQNIIDIILEKQNVYAIDRDIMLKMNNYIETLDDFDNDFIVHYLNFIEVLNPFFEMLIDKLRKYEQELIIDKEIVSGYYFTFTFNEFYEKEVLLPFKDMINSLQCMFEDNALLQAIIFFMHINTLLKRYGFINNKVRIVNNIPVIDIDYGIRIENYKEEYITNYRHELEEGIRTGVFMDDGDILEYVKRSVVENDAKFDI